MWYEKTFNLVLVGIFSIDNLKVNGNAPADVQRNKYEICFVCFLNFSGAKIKNVKMKFERFSLFFLHWHERLNISQIPLKRSQIDSQTSAESSGVLF